MSANSVESMNGVRLRASSICRLDRAMYRAHRRFRSAQLGDAESEFVEVR